MYNESQDLSLSLAVHAANMSGQSEPELHGLLARLHTVVSDFKNAAEAIEASMSKPLRDAIEKYSRA